MKVGTCVFFSSHWYIPNTLNWGRQRANTKNICEKSTPDFHIKHRRIPQELWDTFLVLHNGNSVHWVSHLWAPWESYFLDLYSGPGPAPGVSQDTHFTPAVLKGLARCVRQGCSAQMSTYQPSRFSHVRLFVTLRTGACHTSLSMGFSR